jgi:hypothetical protein
VKRRAIALLSALAVLGGGCGQYLGDYRLESVRLVRELPKSYVSSYPEYFEIELSSEVDLTALVPELDAIYPKADFCPGPGSGEVIVRGPVTDEGEDVNEPSLARRPWRQADGRFHYRLFVVAAHPLPGVRYSKDMMQRPRYDLRKGRRDICLRLTSPGYNLIPSRSAITRVRASLLVAAAEAAPRPLEPRGSRRTRSQF